MFELRAVTVDEMRTHGGECLAEQWAELGCADMVLDVHWPTYLAAEQAGMLSILGAWAGATLVAYCASFVSPALYTMGLAWRVESTYVRRAWRGRWLAPRMIDRVMRLARGRGCRPIVWEARPGSRLARLLERMGFGHAVTVFELGGA